MARMKCRCSAGMGTSECPSPYSIAIYYEDEIEQAISKNPQLTLNDFLCDWDEINDCQYEYMKRSEPVDYWYCLNCKRVYEMQQKIGGICLRVFSRQPVSKNTIDISGWKKIYVLPDVVTDVATETDFKITLADFLKNYSSPRYYISNDEKTIVVMDHEDHTILYSYTLEA